MIEVCVPRESVNDEYVIVQRVMVRNGAFAAANEVVVEVETTKTTIEIVAPVGGIVRHNLEVGNEIIVGGLLFSVGDGEAPAAVTPAATTSSEAPDHQSNANSPPPKTFSEPAVLSKAAEALARRLNSDLAPFAGRWVTESELLDRHVDRAAAPVVPSNPARTYIPPTDVAGFPRPELAHDEKIHTKRKRAEVESLLRGAHAATTSTIGISIPLPGERLVVPDFLFQNSISDLVIFEAARLLRQFPELNGFNIDSRTAGQYHAINFGISFDNHRNLKVLALRNADKLGLPEIQRQYIDLLDLYESNGSLPVELLTTATVTLSDLSPTGASFMLPLINGQQSMILGIVRHHRRLFELFASFDHRVSEGLQVTRFLEALRERLISHFRGNDGAARLNCDSCGKSIQDEIRLGGRGFVNVTLINGDTGNLCRNCFEGR